MIVVEYVKQQVRRIGGYTLQRYAHEIKLDQNENPFGFPDDLKEEVWRRVRDRDWARYTDFHMEEITGRIADYVGFEPERVLVGNGSNDLIQSILMVTLEPGDAVVVPQPTFTLYGLMATILGAVVHDVFLQPPEFSLPVDEMIRTAQSNRAKAVILCSPNNPTGNILPDETIRAVLEETESLVIVDAAYAEFCAQDLRELARRNQRVLLLRTFSKAMAMAGLRVGYLVGDGDLLREVAKARLPYSLNHFSETAAFVALDHIGRLEKMVHEIMALREDLYAQMLRVDGVRPFRSEANFILFETRLSPDRVFEGLIHRGVLVRNVSGYPLLDRCLRVTVGRREENSRFLEALQAVLAEGD